MKQIMFKHILLTKLQIFLSGLPRGRRKESRNHSKCTLSASVCFFIDVILSTHSLSIWRSICVKQPEWSMSTKSTFQQKSSYFRDQREKSIFSLFTHKVRNKDQFFCAFKSYFYLLIYGKLTEQTEIKQISILKQQKFRENSIKLSLLKNQLYQKNVYQESPTAVVTCTISATWDWFVHVTESFRWKSEYISLVLFFRQCRVIQFS